jgi:hypothetical protein
MSKESIVDASVPSAGRMYDYYLGGHHNFEVDRQAAEQVLRMFPFVSKAVRLQRWCLQDIASELTLRRGFDTIVDFASGLPTQDHIHTVVDAGTTVIYSDYDPVVVEYAREILGDTPNVYFFEADARRPDELLKRPEVEHILAGQTNVAITFWGIALFLTDQEVSRALQLLYDATSPESCLVFNAQFADMDIADNPDAIRAVKIYEQIGSPIHLRTKEQYRELAKPWRPDSQGFTSLLDWHGFGETELAKEDRKVFGPGGAGYGVYMTK